MPLKNGADLQLHYHPSSFYSQKVLMSLYQKKLKFRPVYVDINNGKQFTDKFLALNPRGEVPVLVDDVRVIPGSALILNYLEDNFSNGTPRLLPADLDLRQRVEQLHLMIHELKVEPLTLGSVMHDDLELNRKAPYNNPVFRSQIKSVVDNRPALLQSKVGKHPLYGPHLSKKLQEIEADSVVFNDRKMYEDLILSFEKIMDECEAELSSHEQNNWWLASPGISIADVSFSILLHRLWLLGFEKKMWGKSRPNIKRYFARVQQLESFKQATTIKPSSRLSEVVSNPIFWGCVGALAAIGGGLYLWHKRAQGEGFEFLEGFFGLFSEDPASKAKAAGKAIATTATATAATTAAVTAYPRGGGGGSVASPSGYRPPTGVSTSGYRPPTGKSAEFQSGYYSSK